MIDLRERVEQARLRVRLSQAQLSRTLGITQGHYSKVMSGKVPFTDDLHEKMEAWLETQQEHVVGPQVARRMQELAASIRQECMELMRLASLAGAQGGDRDQS